MIKYSTLLIGLITFISITDTSAAEPGNSQQKIEQHQYVEKLEKINFLPSLLPVIIKNSDVIELTDEQLQTMLDWREQNRQDIITTMNKIAGKRIEIIKAALSPNTSSGRLIQMQNEVFRLQREMLEHKLSCRELIINTFNEDNWENLFLVLSEKDLGVTFPEKFISRR